MPSEESEESEDLGGSLRSSARRVRQGSGTVIVKSFTEHGSWVRESAALAVLPLHVRAPRLLSADESTRTVIMSDLGTGTSVADALLGSDPSAATEAVYAWTDAIAALHIATLGVRDAFAASLTADVPLTAATTWLDETVDHLRAAAEAVDVVLPPALVSIWHDQLVRLADDARSALSPADACPDNNVTTADGLALIDFEGAEWRQVAWDASYLTVPWPSCWCSWRLPEDLSERAVARYRATVAPHLPYVATPEFEEDLTMATCIWALVYSSFFLPSALGEDPPPRREGLYAPKRRAFILHRLDLVRRTSPVAEIAAFAEEFRKALVDRWGEVPLALAPAFR